VTARTGGNIRRKKEGVGGAEKGRAITSLRIEKSKSPPPTKKKKKKPSGKEGTGGEEPARSGVRKTQDRNLPAITKEFRGGVSTNQRIASELGDCRRPYKLRCLA